MNGRCILLGLVFLVLGFMIALPSIILSLAESSIKGETDIGRLILNETNNALDNPITGEVAKSFETSFKLIDSIPWILIVIGFIIIIIGIFV